jgi:hypothetical protein
MTGTLTEFKHHMQHAITRQAALGRLPAPNPSATRAPANVRCAPRLPCRPLSIVPNASPTAPAARPPPPDTSTALHRFSAIPSTDL